MKDIIETTVDQKCHEKLSKESSLPEKITYKDLLNLLENDKQVQGLIRSLIQTENQIQGDSVSVQEQLIKPHLKTESATNLASKYQNEAEYFYTELSQQLEFLKAVQSDQEIATLWLKKDENQATSLVRLLTRASQWDQLTELWDMLSVRCKKDERGLNNIENQLLQHSLSCYNLTLNNRQAELTWIDLPTTFDHQCHSRGTPQGNKVISVWLPGLKNAAGILQKKPLVATQ